MAAERPAGDLGTKLREARDRKGLSLREIADATKISARVLESLERNDISRLPGGIFGRSFVRAFATEVGLDPEAAIEEFIAQFPFDSVTAGHPQSVQIEDSQALESGRRIASIFLWLTALSLVLGAVVVYFTVIRKRPPAKVPSAGVSSVVQNQLPRKSAVERTDRTRVTPTAGDAPVKRLNITLSVSRPCRLVAMADGRSAIDRWLQPGEEAKLEVRRDLELTVGDAEAVLMTINGVRAKPLGKTGQGVTTRVTLANFEAYLSAR